MKTLEIRNTFLNYFKSKGHSIIPSASVVPENDASVLFTTAGMQPLVPYLLGEKHPEGKRLTDYQKCIRTVDIDEVGDNRHLTFFEMLGNWSLGDYFKEESIAMSFDLLVNHLNIPIEKLSVTCFEGDENAPKDMVAFEAWKKAGIPEERIYFFGKKDNWWIAGESGPCGPDTEIFYDNGKEVCCSECNPSCDCGKYIEIWNNVFMEYYKDEEGKYTLLKQQNVDTGMGLERISMVLQGLETPYDLEMFVPVMKWLEENSQKDDISSRRVVAEHFRSSSIMIADGVYPSNTDRGYILRRLLRRAVTHLNKLEVPMEKYEELIKLVISSSSMLYTELEENKEKISEVILGEVNKFAKTVIRGRKEFEKIISRNGVVIEGKMNPKEAFKLYETHGLPIEVTLELAKEKNIVIDKEEIDKLFEEHQEKSRAGSENKFKGGLANHNEMTIKYHTATHLLHKALQEVLGDHALQKGSNITEERLRFDFSHDAKMTKEEIQKVEELVNKKIAEDLIVTFEETTYEEAKKKGVIGLFGDRYAEKITVYHIGEFSSEVCGGPHVQRTGNMGTFKITKEEAVSKGVRRIKAILI